MSWPDVTDADLNAFVDLELGADDLPAVMLRLFCTPKAVEQVAAYARQRSIMTALRGEIGLPPAGERLADLEEQLCRWARLAEQRRAEPLWQEPQKPLVVVIQRPTDPEVGGDVPRRHRLRSLPQHVEDDPRFVAILPPIGRTTDENSERGVEAGQVDYHLLQRVVEALLSRRPVRQAS